LADGYIEFKECNGIEYNGIEYNEFSGMLDNSRLQFILQPEIENMLKQFELKID
jgi:hypothetical protein